MVKAKHIRPRKTLLPKLVVAFVVPTLGLFSLFAFFAYQVQRNDLEAELGRRLEAVAGAAATQLRGKYLAELQPGDESDNLYYSGGMHRLEQMAAATGVERLYVFDRDFLTRLDTAGGLIGDKQFQAEIDRKELAGVFEAGKTASSLLFFGVDGRAYKAGYAPVALSEDEPEVVLAIGADAPADFFDRLAGLRRQLVTYGVLLFLAVAALAVLIGLRITRPVRALAEAAERIGAGDLARPIETLSRDEIGLLAMTMETMRSDLRTRDERMQLMLAGIAHEVRNPLGGMELFSGILHEELEGDEEKRGHVDRIKSEIGHLKVVVESFLDYARRPAPQMASVDLAALAKDVADLEAGRARESGVELELNLCALRCSGDATQLRRAVLNLLRNAIQAATGTEEAVVMACSEEDGWAELSVHNMGAPIPEEVQEHLFEPFFTTKQKGTGLGLAFVKEIIEDHGGTIALESSAETGTRFTFRLPLPSKTTTPSEAA